MIKILIPEIKGRQKTSIRGFWRNEAGQIFYDYLKVIDYNKSIETNLTYVCFRQFLDELKIKYNQEAIFYNAYNLGYCYYNRDKIDVLRHRIYAEVKRVNLRQEIREALRQYSGVTIYQEGKRYFKEIYYK